MGAVSTDPNEAQKDENERLMKEVATAVAEQLENGISEAAIVDDMVANGADRQTAADFAHGVADAMGQVRDSEAFSVWSIAPALSAGGLGAVGSGMIWGLIAIYTGYEVGYVAWGIGLVCGMAVAFGARRARGPVFQVIAAASSITGILVGKYVAFAHFLEEAVRTEYGAEAATLVDPMSTELIGIFTDSLPELGGAWDLLWLFLAVGTAWRMLRRADFTRSE